MKPPLWQQRSRLAHFPIRLLCVHTAAPSLLPTSSSIDCVGSPRSTRFQREPRTKLSSHTPAKGLTNRTSSSGKMERVLKQNVQVPTVRIVRPRDFISQVSDRSHQVNKTAQMSPIKSSLPVASPQRQSRTQSAEQQLDLVEGCSISPDPHSRKRGRRVVIDDKRDERSSIKAWATFEGWKFETNLDALQNEEFAVYRNSFGKSAIVSRFQLSDDSSNSTADFLKVLHFSKVLKKSPYFAQIQHLWLENVKKESADAYVMWNGGQSTLYHDLQVEKMKYSDKQILNVMKPLFRGLAQLHEANLMYGNLSTRSIIRSEGGFKLLPSSCIASDCSRKRRQGGSEFFLDEFFPNNIPIDYEFSAPESLLYPKCHVDASDMWAAGIILLKMVALATLDEPHTRWSAIRGVQWALGPLTSADCAALQVPMGLHPQLEMDQTAARFFRSVFSDPRSAKVCLTRRLGINSEKKFHALIGELIRKLLVFDPLKRLRATEVLKDPLLKKSEDKADVMRHGLPGYLFRKIPTVGEAITRARRLETFRTNVSSGKWESISHAWTTDTDTDTSTSEP